MGVGISGRGGSRNTGLQVGVVWEGSLGGRWR